MKTGNSRYTEETRKRINKQRNDHKEERNQAIVRKARDVPCTDCGGVFPYCCMEFDHVPERGPKLFHVCGTSIRHKSAIVLTTEINKCDVVCANCHRIRTDSRTGQGGWRTI